MVLLFLRLHLQVLAFIYCWTRGSYGCYSATIESFLTLHPSFYITKRHLDLVVLSLLATLP